MKVHLIARRGLFGMLGMAAAAGVLAIACGSSSASEPTPSSTPQAGATQPAPADSPTPAATPSSVALAAVGDLMLGRSIGYRIEADGPGIVFDDAINNVLREADITAGNLEMVVSEFGSPQPKGYTFRAPVESIAALQAAGFDVVSQANNHAMDFGRLALLDTAENLRASGIEPVGAGPDIAAASKATVIERNGLRIAFVGLVDAPAEGPGFSRDSWEATADRAGVAWADVASVTNAVHAASASADLVVVMLHFGIEYATEPTATQQRLAHAAIDAGASLVIGSHPHVLQEVEEYGGGLIAYSLGNFVFDGFDGSANETAILKVTLTANGVESWKLVPVDIVKNGLPRLHEE